MDNACKGKICVVTGTRKESGRLYWLMKESKDDSDLELQVVGPARHLSSEFGSTYRKVEEDDLTIEEKVEMLVSRFLFGKSAGWLYEAPTVKVSVANAGLRQRGHLQVANIISSIMGVIP